LLGLDFEEGDAVERFEGLALTIDLPADAERSGYPITVGSSAGRLAGFDFAELDTKLLFRGSRLDIERSRLELTGGSVEVAGNVTFGPPGQSPFTLDTQLVNLDANELAAVLVDLPRGIISGRISGDVQLTGDSLEWETLKRSLAGKVALEVGAGALEDVNLLERLIGQLVADPGLGSLAAASIRDAAPAALQGTRTAFDRADLALRIANGALEADALELVTGDFAILAAGKLGLDGALSGDGSIRFSEDLSRKIRAKAKKFAPLLGDGEFVALPLLLDGSLTAPRLNADLAAMAATAQTNATQELQQEAADKLSRAIFGKKKEPEDGTPAAPAETERDAVEGLLEEGLGKLFGK
jgi:hypothetical protein